MVYSVEGHSIFIVSYKHITQLIDLNIIELLMEKVVLDFYMRNPGWGRE